MRNLWHLNTDLQREAHLALASLRHCFELDGKLVSRDMKSSVIRTEIGGETLYVKRYTKGGKSLRHFLGRSRVKAEWENHLLFTRLGIDTPPLLAYGQEYRNGQFRRGALVTREVQGAKSLEQLASERHPALRDRALFRQIAARIAEFTHTLHKNGFTHNDLDWRNILVVLPEKGQAPRVLFFDCPGGRFWFGPFLQHRIVKDLSHLDKLARHHLPLRWRLWFYRQYTGKKKLTLADKKRLKKIDGFFDEARYRSWLRW